MSITSVAEEMLGPEAAEYYRRAMRAVASAGVPFLVGGAYALGYYTGIIRHTKDFDFFVRPEDGERILEALSASLGCRTEMTFPHWLGKAHHGDDFCDVIFSSGNGVCRVDDVWFEHATPAEMLGEQVGLIPAEEMIWSKGFVLERERYDGADITHLLRARGDQLDWERLLDRFGPHWRVLLSHLILFGFVYPTERDKVSEWVMNELLTRVQEEQQEPVPTDRLCRGTLLSREQYFKDIQEWGYKDGRLTPEKFMSKRDIRHWTDAANIRK
ncbi:MAG TPA: hypothetical protein VKD72_13335 [Gemmataceae bacterium]|nr:hypothetical protein [Gemmataceae bacterium]